MVFLCNSIKNAYFFSSFSCGLALVGFSVCGLKGSGAAGGLLAARFPILLNEGKEGIKRRKIVLFREKITDSTQTISH